MIAALARSRDLLAEDSAAPLHLLGVNQCLVVSAASPQQLVPAVGLSRSPAFLVVFPSRSPRAVACLLAGLAPGFAYADRCTCLGVPSVPPPRSSVRTLTELPLSTILYKNTETGAEGFVSDHSTIEWTDATWNPVRGCTKISPGCAHCYAETFAERFRGVAGHPYERGFDLRTVPEKLAEPLRWATPRMIFVNSMSDLFHKDVPDDYIVRVAQVMRVANWHTYQVLTKRSERLRDLLQSKLADVSELPHIWWGVSVENQKHGLPRIEHLRAAPASIRFLSIEPLLEDLGRVNLAGINWVIVGWRAGQEAQADAKVLGRVAPRPVPEAGVPFFFKQWGGCRKGEAGRELDGVTYDELPNRVNGTTLPIRERRSLIAELTVV